MKKYAAIIVVMFALLLSILAVLIQTYRAAQRSAPLEYTQSSYTPDRAVYRPGDSLVYTPTLVVRHEGRVNVLRTFWDLTRNQSAQLCSGVAAKRITIENNLPVGIVGNVRGGRSVPVRLEDLPNGDYALITSASGPDGGQGVYEVRFTVVGSCGGG